MQFELSDEQLEFQKSLRRMIGDRSPVKAVREVIKTEAGNVTVRTAPQVRVAPGDRVGLEVQALHVNWFDPDAGRRLS